MPGRKVRIAQTSFYAGELSPYLAARSDKPAFYANGAEKLTNRRPLAQGGNTTRDGLKYLATFAHTAVRLKDFVFADDQRYVFVFADARCDVYSTAGAILVSLTSAPWDSSMLARLSFAQAGDTTIVFHSDMAPQIIKRTGASTFTLADLAFEENSAGHPKYQPYYKYADAAITLTPSATTGTGINLTLSGAGAFTSDHVGTIIRYKGKEILVQTVTSATAATGDVRETLAATTADTDWDEQTFSAVRGWPVSGTFFSNRLIFGGAKSLPGGFFASKTGAFYNFDVGTGADSDAIIDEVGSNALSEVRFVSGVFRLVLFCADGFYLVPTDTNNPLTPANLAFQKQAPYGCAYVAPFEFDGALLFLQKTGATVREAVYDYLTQVLTSDAVALLGAHLISSPTESAPLYGSTNRPEQYALFLNGDGNLSVFHSIRSQQVAAWVPWETNGTFESICAAGGDVFVAVKRSINGSDVWFLEMFDPDVAPLDATIKVTSGSATRTFSGFDHLAGETVGVVTKGHDLGDYTVSAAGVITLGDSDPEVTEIEAGMRFTQLIRPMPAVFDLPDGPSRGLKLRLVRAIAQTYEAASFTLDGTTVLLDFQGDDFATAPSTKTGLIEFRTLGVDTEAQFDLEIPKAVKVPLLGLTREIEIYG